MIKNIVFDMGNVLIKYDPASVLRGRGVSEEDIALIFREFYDYGSIRFCDRGVKTYKQVIGEAEERLPERLTDILYSLYVEQSFGVNEMPPFPEMYDLVSELKEKGYGLYLLSNAGFDYYDYSRCKPVLSIIDNKFISCEYRLLKPEPEIYAAFFRRFGLDPAECVFTDDMPANVEGSKKCGMDAICFSPSLSPVSELRAELNKRGVAV